MGLSTFQCWKIVLLTVACVHGGTDITNRNVTRSSIARDHFTGAVPTHTGLPTEHRAATSPRRAQARTCRAFPGANLDTAWEWARRSILIPPSTGMIAYQNGIKIFEEYDETNICALCGIPLVRSLFHFFQRILSLFSGMSLRAGGAPEQSFKMYSMTKSLAGLAALLMRQQGFIPSLDEPVATYIPEWQTDGPKSAITIRELLTLESGIATISEMPPLAVVQAAIHSPYLGRKKWVYGPQPFLVFAKLMQTATGQDPVDYLEQNLFAPLGMSSITFERTTDFERLPKFSSGGQTTLTNMAKLGMELSNAVHGVGTIFTPQDMEDFVTPGSDNPAYGLSVWLNADGRDSGGNVIGPFYAACGNHTVLQFKGVGGQLMAIIPEQNLVLVKSARTGLGHFYDLYWDRVFADQDCLC